MAHSRQWAFHWSHDFFNLPSNNNSIHKYGHFYGSQKTFKNVELFECENTRSENSFRCGRIHNRPSAAAGTAAFPTKKYFFKKIVGVYETPLGGNNRCMAILVSFCSIENSFRNDQCKKFPLNLDTLTAFLALLWMHTSDEINLAGLLLEDKLKTNVQLLWW